MTEPVKDAATVRAFQLSPEFTLARALPSRHFFEISMPPIPNKKPKCIACGGSGVSSSGRPCEPCRIRGVLITYRPPTVKPITKLAKPFSVFD